MSQTETYTGNLPINVTSDLIPTKDFEIERTIIKKISLGIELTCHREDYHHGVSVKLG